MNIIDSSRLYLRNFSVNDSQAFFQLIQNYTNNPISKHDHEWPNNEIDLQNVLAWFCSQDDYLAVIMKNEDKLIGFVNMTKENTPDEIVYSLGYIFHSQYHGFGYAFEACSAYMNYIHKNNKEYSIICGTSEANTKSCNLLEKLGFKQIQKSKTSFQNDDNNNPILFTGITYKYTNM